MVEVRGLWTNFSLHLKTANFSSLKWAANSSSRKILREILSNSGRVSHLGNTAGRIPKLKCAKFSGRYLRGYISTVFEVVAYTLFLIKLQFCSHGVYQKLERIVATSLVL